MSSKELRRAGVLARVVSGELKLVNAAVMMGLSDLPEQALRDSAIAKREPQG